MEIDDLGDVHETDLVTWIQFYEGWETRTYVVEDGPGRSADRVLRQPGGWAVPTIFGPGTRGARTDRRGRTALTDANRGCPSM